MIIKVQGGQVSFECITKYSEKFPKLTSSLPLLIEEIDMKNLSVFNANRYRRIIKGLLQYLYDNDSPDYSAFYDIDKDVFVKYIKHFTLKTQQDYLSIFYAFHNDFVQCLDGKSTLKFKQYKKSFPNFTSSIFKVIHDYAIERKRERITRLSKGLNKLFSIMHQKKAQDYAGLDAIDNKKIEILIEQVVKQLKPGYRAPLIEFFSTYSESFNKHVNRTYLEQYSEKFPNLTNSLIPLLDSYAKKRDELSLNEMNRHISALLQFMSDNNYSDCSSIDDIDNDVFVKCTQQISKQYQKIRIVRLRELKEKKFLNEPRKEKIKREKKDTTINLDQYKDTFPKFVDAISKIFPEYTADKNNRLIKDLKTGFKQLLSIMSQKEIKQDYVCLDEIDNQKIEQLIKLVYQRYTQILLTKFFCTYSISFFEYTNRGILIRYSETYPNFTNSLRPLLKSYSQGKTEASINNMHSAISALLQFMSDNNYSDCSSIDNIDNDAFKRCTQHYTEQTQKSRVGALKILKAKDFLNKSVYAKCINGNVSLSIEQYREVFPKFVESIVNFFPQYCTTKTTRKVEVFNKAINDLLSIMCQQENMSDYVSSEAIDNKKIQQFIELAYDQAINKGIEKNNVLKYRYQTIQFFCAYSKSFNWYSHRMEAISSEGQVIQMQFFEHEERLPKFISYLGQLIQKYALNHNRNYTRRKIKAINYFVNFLLSSGKTNKDYQSFDEVNYELHEEFKQYVIRTESERKSDTSKARKTRAIRHYVTLIEFIQENCTDENWKNIQLKDPVEQIKCKNGCTVNITIIKYQQDFPNFVCFVKNQLVLYSKKHGNTLIATCNRVTTYFIEFLIYNNAEKDFKSFNEMNPYIFKSFLAWLPEYINSAHTAHKDLSNFFTFVKAYSKYTKYDLPSISDHSAKPHEVYTSDVLNQITKELKTYINQIRQKESLVLKAIRDGRTIDYKFEDSEVSYSINNIAWVIINKWNGQIPLDRKTDNATYACFARYLKLSPDTTKENNTPFKFAEYYSQEQILLLSNTGRNPKGLRSFEVTFTFNDVIKTLAESGEPLYKKFDRTKPYECFSSLITYRFHQSNLKFEISSKGKTIEITSAEELFSYIWPSQEEKMLLMLHYAIQTGWNAGPIIRMSENPLSRILSSTLAILQGGKVKGQQGYDSLDYEKTMYAISNTSDKYSAIRLHDLLIKRTKRLKIIVIQQQINIKSQDLWLYFNGIGNVIGGINKTLDGTFNQAINKWLKLKNITKENGDKLTSIDIKRFRPTWYFYKKKNTQDSQLIQTFLGHNSPTTSDVNYDNHSLARRERFDNLSHALNGVAISIEDGTFKAILIPLRTAEAKKKGLVRGQVFTDDNNRKICLCKDSSNPTWEGASAYISQKGFICRYLSKCTQCSQAVITIDSLPYIIERINYLQKQKDHLSSLEFAPLKKEFKVCNMIIEYWPDEDHIKEARDIAMDEYPLLPVDLIIPGFNDNITIGDLIHER